MKFKITAASNYDNFTTINHGPRRFAIHIDNYDEDDDSSLFLMPKFQISEIHPYDDASYTWAKTSDSSSNVVIFVRSGKVKDRMTLWDYEPEDYENPTEYVNDILDTVATSLMDMNSDVEPQMVHY